MSCASSPHHHPPLTRCIAEKSKCYEMSSFDEKQATTLLKERPLEFVKYNKHQLSRVYPAGTRFDSSNFMPQVSGGIVVCSA